MALGKSFPLFCKGERNCFWEVPHKGNPQRGRHVIPEMLLLAPWPGFQQHLGLPGMALFLFRNGSPPTTMYIVHSDSGWHKLPLSHKQGAQLLQELFFLPPAEWVKLICVSGNRIKCVKKQVLRKFQVPEHESISKVC